jgi:acetyltransferase-like isoleucine patch superfamily enzyme
MSHMDPQVREAASSALGQVAGFTRRLASRLWALEARLRGAELRGTVLFLGRPILTLAPGSTMIFAGRNEVFSSPRCNAIGNMQPCVLRTLARGARLELGPGVGMSSTVFGAASSIVVGEGTIFGAGAMVIDTDFHQPVGEFEWEDAAAQNARPITIGRGCFIGARALVMKGVVLEDRTVVGAGAVVTKRVPSGMMAVGNPARNVPWRGRGSA